MDLKHSWPKLVLGAVVAIAPAVLGYCKASREAEAQAAQTSREADAGYKTLVESVQHLEEIVRTQDATLRYLLGEKKVSISEALGAGSGSAATAAPIAWRPNAPTFKELPLSNAEAFRQITAE